MSAVEAIVVIDQLRKLYARQGEWRRKETIRAVDGVSLTIRRGETLGLVGESGSGKSTTGQMAAGLLPATSGTIRFGGEEIGGLRGNKAKEMRKHIQYVFQDPYTSLNPQHRVAELIEEPLRIHRLGRGAERRERVEAMMSRVGLGPSFARRFPRELSGGQRQRIGIARALMLSPQFVVLDEPVSALDVSVQSQILNLLKELQEHDSLTYLFISHDLNVVHYMSDRVAVMYSGKIVELAEVSKLYEQPLHPYTQALVSAAPGNLRGEGRERIVLQGEASVSSHGLMEGCSFYSRCRSAKPRCRVESPELRQVDSEHAVSCHFA
ncbi:ABC transporter ATP-binding protein [Paenibacillus sp. GCM10027627]|uniref:ABC transporter ATP-binding protein n=1 Tax=unclassified Paenibacillus TaxID=185978 RepID=UPI0036270DF5